MSSTLQTFIEGIMVFGVILISVILISSLFPPSPTNLEGKIIEKHFKVTMHGGSIFKITLQGNTYAVIVPEYVYKNVKVGDYFKCTPDICDR